jgi:16S rRNA processing protein RimM
VPPVASAPESIVVMGRILAPHGVRGWVKIRPVSESPESLLDYEAWWVRPAGASTWRELRRTSGRMHSGVLLVGLSGVATREDALALRGADVGVPRATLPRTKKDEIYWVDLEGLEVVNRKGIMLGTVAEVVAHGAHPLLRVTRLGDGERQAGPDRLIPYVPAIVDHVDLGARRIDVDWGEDY